MKKVLFSFIILCFFISCNNSKEISVTKTKQELLSHKNANDVYFYYKKQVQLKEKTLSDFINNLSLQEKICQLFIASIDGNKTFKPMEKISLIDDSQDSDDSAIVPGGCLLFGFNLSDSPEEVMNYIDSIVDYSIDNNIIPPFISVDQEGGTVNRLKRLCGTYPSEERVAQDLDLTQATELFKLQALQMKSLGFNLNLAPVVEISTDMNKSFLDGRSYGDKAKVLSYGKENINQFEKNKVGTVLKHFPGNTNTDPHTGLPEISLDYNQLMDFIEPFKKLIKENPTGVLMSHAITTAVDNGIPSCLSRIWVTDFLRNKFGFKGVIFSDDIFMGALSKNNYPPEKAVIMAVDAGVDCIMISQKRIASAAKVLYEKALEDSAYEEKITNSVKRIIEYKIINNILKYEKVNEDLYKITPVKNSSKTDRLESFYDAKEKNELIFKKVE